MGYVRFTLAIAAALLTALVAAPLASANKAGTDWVSSDNVEYLGSLKDDVGLTAGAKVIGDRLFVTSGKNISIYNIDDPANPHRVGLLKANVSWENEEVATNGKILGFGSDFYNASPSGGCLQALKVTGCTQFFDVRNPSDIRELPAVTTANHTLECVLDCSYFYGSEGSIVDARDPANAKKIEANWRSIAEDQGVAFNGSPPDVTEVAPGCKRRASPGRRPAPAAWSATARPSPT